jgi:hypothetical protein
MNAIETFVNANGHTVEIHEDHDPPDPREWDNLGTMAFFHRRYRLGDKHNFDSSAELEQFLKESKSVYLNVYMYDHSGITISTRPFCCPWDSGQLGVTYVTKERIIKEYGDFSASAKERALDCLEAEVKTYDDYIRGNVYGFRVLDGEEELDSCWGFYGSDHKESGLMEAANA